MGTIMRRDLFKQILSSFLIYLISVQMVMDKAPRRVPAAYGHDIELEKLFKEIEDFKVEIKGKDLESDCNNDSANAVENAVNDDQLSTPAVDPNTMLASSNTEEQFNKLMTNLKTNACGQYIYSFDPETPAEEMEECKPKHQDGIFDKLISQTMDDEENEKEPEVFKVMDPTVRRLHKKAEFLMSEVRKYLSDDDFEVEQRQNLLLEYLSGVALPMRDLIIVKRAYMPNEYDGAHYYNSLLPEIPTRIFPEDDLEIRDKITLGKDPSTDPFFIEMDDQSWGRTQLRYNETQILSRDILTLTKAPVKRNYIRSLKWMTLHMMLNQIYVYEAMLGYDRPVKIPRSCQNHFNADLPEEFKFKFIEGQGVSYMDNILQSQGLTIDDNGQYFEYYMNNVDLDPTKNGYSGLMPFQEYKNAGQGLQKKSGPLSPSVDDITHYDRVLGLKLPEANKIFKGTVKVGPARGAKKTKSITYKGAELWDKIIRTPEEGKVYEIQIDEENKTLIDPKRQNLSIYLAELIQRKNAVHFEDVISDSVKEKLSTQRVTIDFPSLYGSAVWRSWGLQKLQAVFEQNIDSPDSRILNILKYRCKSYGYGSNKLCSNDPVATIANLSDFLSEFTAPGKYTPIRRLKESGLENVYPILSNIWNDLRDKTNLLPEAKPVELDFLVDQMKAHNPWARVRLSYVMAIDELEHWKDGHEPTYSHHSRRGRVMDSNSTCYFRNMNTRLSKIQEAAAKLGIDRPIVPSHATNVLSKDEKEYLWKDILDTTDEGNSRLFTVVASDGKEYYSHLENLSYQTILTKESLDETVSKLPIRLHDEDEKSIEEVLNSPMAKHGEFFLELYKERGNPEKQKKMFEKFSAENGIDNEFLVKLNFLSLDNDLKRPVFHSLIRQAAYKRKMAIVDSLNEFCDLEPTNHARFKALFYSTTKAQSKLNQMAGLPGVPEKILDYMNSMSPEEWTDLKLGLGAGLLGVGAILIGSACAGITGGLCAPLSVVMIGAGLKALDMQMELVGRELDRKLEADDLERQVQTMEGLGFTDRGSASQVSRSWFWTAFEVISLIPMVGVVSRSASVGTKLAVVSGKNLIQRTGKVAFKQSAKRVLQEADVKLARYVLGFDSLASDFGLSTAARAGGKPAADAAADLTARLAKAGVPKEQVAKTITDYKKVMFLFSKGKLSTDGMIQAVGKLLSPFRTVLRGTRNVLAREVGRVAVTESVQTIDKQAAKIVSEYFGHNAKAFHKVYKTRLMQGMLGGDRLTKAVKAWDKVKDVTWFVGQWPVLPKNPTVLNRVAHAFKAAGYVGHGLSRTPYKFWTWIKKMRVEHLAKYADKIRAIEKELAVVAKNGGDLEKFISKHMDDLTDIFMNAPMRKRELPYIIFWQGAPHIGGVGQVPFLHHFADGMILRKFFTARGRLVYESLKAEARSTLGLSKYVAAETTMGAFKSFQESVANAAEQMTEEASQKFLKQYDDMEKQIVKKLYQSVTQRADDGAFRYSHGAQVMEMSEEAFRRYIFNPRNIQEEALGHAIWESAPVDDLLDMRNLGDVAHRVVQELANYKNVDEFQRFVNALKVLTIQRDPGVVEFM
ncbi:MAG: hypothetical protein EP319_03240 [Deltaproteobacteria bacterium]|nr:MAG: hypothetical protein EP319_03240 [Deltaproteobacteria bacterium]